MTATVTPLGTHLEAEKLRITEIFASIQGESTSVGMPTVFVRLTGCPLRCQYCDTAYAFSGGEWMRLDEIATKVKSFNLKHVTVTGGEPLAQKSCLSLLCKLCDQNYKVSLETSGALNISEVDPRVVKVMDIKTPASQEVSKNLWENIGYLREQDQVKFVICSHSDYVWAKNILAESQLRDRCEVLFSPVMDETDVDQFEAKQLAEWIVQDQLDVRFQLQLHKILWGNVPGK
ncbi:MAG: 7-carboxy-7-deazaguanine synthase QueE [Gammaproteobacteria bacterium]|nr:7-carboxy-7-deazaguanine synthase QueE [Gammaproteobacteria bacterium]